MFLDQAAIDYISPVYQMLNENDSFSIFCNATGNPLPTIKWLKMGKVVHVGERMTVPRAQLKNNGTYTCLASNGIGVSPMAFVEVIVNGEFSMF